MEPQSEAAGRTAASAARLAGLDALRGIAALCVLDFHIFALFGSDPAFDGKGYLAVDFFFMLSGYVMARTYEHRLAEGYSPLRFIAGRYRRLWPVMAIGTVLGTPLLAIELGDPSTAFAIALANLFFIPTFATRMIFPVNAAAWSILAELLANLAHGLMFWRWRARHVALMVATALPFLVWAAVHFDGLDVGAGVANAFGGVVRAIAAYGLGIVLWRLWRDRPALRVAPLAAFAAMPVLTVLSQVLQIKAWHFDIAFVMLACPLLIAGGLAYTGDNRAGRWLGMLSFPLYAVNLPVLLLSRQFGLGPLPGIVCALLLAACIAWRGASPKAARTRSGESLTAAKMGETR
jgi:peptidoglycan/LPS O-acetylase OafA/YrhL